MTRIPAFLLLLLSALAYAAGEVPGYGPGSSPAGAFVDPHGVQGTIDAPEPACFAALRSEAPRLLLRDPAEIAGGNPPTKLAPSLDVHRSGARRARPAAPVLGGRQIESASFHDGLLARSGALSSFASSLPPPPLA